MTDHDPHADPASGDDGPDDEALARAEAEAAHEAMAADEAMAEAAPPVGDGMTSADYATVFSPRNLAVGLAVVAGLVAFAASRRRRGRREGD